MGTDRAPQSSTSELASEEEVLEEGIRRIVTSRERTPRSPQWGRAWWHALMRYTERLSELRRQVPAGEPSYPSEREDISNR